LFKIFLLERFIDLSSDYYLQAARGAEGEENTGAPSQEPYHNESAVFHRLGINREDKPFGILAKELESPAFSPSQVGFGQ
jgi:hypothetical protein